jgi:hypothetical protein
MLKSLEVPDTIENIYVLGVLSSRSKDFLFKKFCNFKVIHIELPYDTIENIYKFCPKNFTNKDLIICTLPTPKQEQLSELIIKNSKFYKIICIGGAVAMASGDEKTIPAILDKLNLE